MTTTKRSAKLLGRAGDAGHAAVLSDSATPSNINASNFLTGKENTMLNPIFGMLSSRAIKNIPDMPGWLSLMVKKLYAIKIYEIAESGNTGRRRNIARRHVSWLWKRCLWGQHVPKGGEQAYSLNDQSSLKPKIQLMTPVVGYIDDVLTSQRANPLLVYINNKLLVFIYLFIFINERFSVKWQGWKWRFVKGKRSGDSVFNALVPLHSLLKALRPSFLLS